MLKVGDKISIRPGKITRNPKTAQVSWKEIESQITSLQADNNSLMYAVPGGLIAVGLRVDPFITRADSLVGQLIGHVGKMPDVLNEIDVEYNLLKRLLGVKQQGDGSQGGKVSSLKTDELLMINVGS